MCLFSSFAGDLIFLILLSLGASAFESRAPVPLHDSSGGTLPRASGPPRSLGNASPYSSDFTTASLVGSGVFDSRVLTPHRLELHLEMPRKWRQPSFSDPNILIDRPALTLPLPSVRARSTPDLEPPLSLILEVESTVYPLGKFAFLDGQAQVRIPPSLYQEISLKHPHRIALLKVENLDSGGFETLLKVFIGGAEDTVCRRPVLISDWNGTLEPADSCSRNFLMDLIQKDDANLVVVSSMGSYVPTHQLALAEDRVMTLPNWGLASSAEEKLSRIATQFWGSGACLLAFAGDSPAIEGFAAKALGIPYWAVNQVSRIQYQQITEVQQVCQFVGEQVKEFKKSCGSSYRKEDVREIECQELGSKLTFWRQVPRNLSSNDLGLQGWCGPGGIWNRNERVRSICYWDQPLEQPSLEGKCPAPYVLQQRASTRMQEIGRDPNIDIQKFPVGSIYAGNWCELRAQFEKSRPTPLDQKRERK